MDRIRDTSEARRVDFRRAIFDWCLRNAETCLQGDDLDGTLKWDFLAARMAHFDCAMLASSQLESHLLAVAASQPAPPAVSHTGPRRWVHVSNVAVSVGGHTAMLRNWVKLDRSESTHSLVLLEQDREVPRNVRDTIERTGGEIVTLDHQPSFWERAKELRALLWEKADVVVLHISPFDVIAATALGVEGGPPVLLVNHAAHIFWVGTSIADRVLICRGSAEERRWTAEYRGVELERIRTLPIPLSSDATAATVADPSAREDARRRARADLKFDDGQVVLLTVGRAQKYTPVGELDFLNVVERILLSRPHVCLIAVGPDEDERWKAVKYRTNGRLLAVGEKADWRSYREAADLYLEGFPFGSTTALFEAGLSGLPCVLPPRHCPPPFTTDGVALDDGQAPDAEAYIQSVLALIDQPDARHALGCQQRTSIERHHTDAGWSGYLQSVQSSLPTAHQVHSPRTVPSVPEEYVEYWSAFVSRLSKVDYFAWTFGSALTLGLRPVIDRRLWNALRSGRAARGRNRLGNGLATVCATVGHVLPARWVRSLYSWNVKAIGDGGFVIGMLGTIVRKAKLRGPLQQQQPSL